MSRLILGSVIAIVGLSSLVGVASFSAWGLPTESNAISVRLDTPSLLRTYRGGTRSFGK